jgi:hypothetical protein
LFFVFFSQDDIFMALALVLAGRGEGRDGSGAHADQLIKRWVATARAAPRGFAINAGAKAQASSRRSAAIA